MVSLSGGRHSRPRSRNAVHLLPYLAGRVPLRERCPHLDVALRASLALAAAACPALGAARERLVHVVPRATSEVRVDGVLDEPAWRDALRLELGYEVEPGENVPPPVSTEVLLTHDSSRLLVAFVASDPRPGEIRAHLSDRDDAWDDDWLGIALDTFDDQRRAFELLANPLGVQMDAVNDDSGGEYDTSWDAIWSSAGRITAEGYQVEMAIPFHQLRFPATDGPQTWGFDAFRSYPRSVRHHLGLWPRQRGANSYLAQADAIVGFAGVSPGRNLELAPTVTAQRTDRQQDPPSGPLVEGEVEVEVGVTGRWGLSTGLTLTAAANPDFSQVEADAVMLDVNQQFALFYPEKRPFFLEGADFFNTPVDLLYTRTIADPSAALKLTGKEGRHTLGVFAATDEVTNLVLPGVDGSASASFDLQTTASVLRYKADLGERSSLGTMVTARDGGGYHNRVLSVDGLWRPGAADSLSVNLAVSATRYADEMVAELGAPDEAIEDRALRVSYGHSERDWNASAVYRDLGDDFRADLGFVTRVGFRELEVGAERIWFGDQGGPFTRLELGGNVSLTEEQDGDLLENEAEAWLSYRGPLQSEAVLSASARTYVFAGVDFDQLGVHLGGELRPTGDLSLDLSLDAGDWVDFASVRPGDFVGAEASVAYRLGRHLALEGSYAWEALDVDGGRLYSAGAAEARLVYQLDRRAFARVVLQHVDVRRTPELWPEPVEARSRDLFAQLLLSFELNPQTVAYLGYSDRRLGTDVLELTQTDRTLFLKLGYAWMW